MAPVETIGIIPASGLATRLDPLPCSKELFPVGFQEMGESGEVRPKVVCHYLLEKMQYAGIETAYIIIRKGKWDIPSYFGDGSMVNMSLSYLIMNLPYGVPFTVDQAYPFIKNANIALGFPDILFNPKNAFKKLMKKLHETQADIVLALMRINSPEKWDMVELDANGNILRIEIKPIKTKLKYGWVFAVWKPNFTNFMHNYLKLIKSKIEYNADVEEIHMGNVIQVALEKKISIEYVFFPLGNCVDIGTAEDLYNSVKLIKKNCLK